MIRKSWKHKGTPGSTPQPMEAFGSQRKRGGSPEKCAERKIRAERQIPVDMKADLCYKSCCNKK